MHRVIQDHLEAVLSEAPLSELPQFSEASPSSAAAHLQECQECREEVALMRRHASLLRAMAPPAPSPEPRPGFYARVMERIEAQRPISIFKLFFESTFGRRLALASMSLAFLFSVYLVSSERMDPQPLVVPSESQSVISTVGLPDKDAVLVNLVTYREP